MKYLVHRQLSVAIENQPGRLAAIGRLMADAGINIKDLSVVDNVEQGMIRLVTSDPAACKALLVREGLYVVEADVLEVILRDTPGQLAVLGQALADAQINIDYAYGSEDPSEEHVRIVMKVSNLTRACEVIDSLREN
ncbi:MAG TPA: ACT domain-containing protein [Methylomirabilota bacterium]|nr:ACT domain-containing protein [Methylomirabilota bacterium]